MLLSAISSLLTPTAARIGYPVMIANRVIIGIGMGVFVPSLHSLLGKWCPPFERSRLANFTYTGAPIGNIVTMLVSGPLCDSTFLGGWPSVFYIAGSLGCLFFIAWMYVVYDSPAVHPRVSMKEQRYIESTVGENNYDQAAILSSLPFLCLWLTFVVGSWIADTLLERHILGMTTTRKLMNTIGFVGAAVFLVPAGYAGYWNRILTMALISLSMSCIGFCLSGYHTNSLDIAPKYSGVIYGYSSTLACSAGFIGPIVMGELLEAKEKHTAWLIVFCISAGVYIFGMITFLVCGTADEQAWGSEDKDKRKIKDYDEIPNATRNDSK
ncbi:putative inorganic phosphate cotransporter [Glandiceps talaboti]